jgi:hypothetical protein
MPWSCGNCATRAIDEPGCRKPSRAGYRSCLARRRHLDNSRHRHASFMVRTRTSPETVTLRQAGASREAASCRPSGPTRAWSRRGRRARVVRTPRRHPPASYHGIPGATASSCPLGGRAALAGSRAGAWRSRPAKWTFQKTDFSMCGSPSRGRLAGPTPPRSEGDANPGASISGQTMRFRPHRAAASVSLRGRGIDRVANGAGSRTADDDFA